MLNNSNLADFSGTTKTTKTHICRLQEREERYYLKNGEIQKFGDYK